MLDLTSGRVAIIRAAESESAFAYEGKQQALKGEYIADKGRLLQNDCPKGV